MTLHRIVSGAAFALLFTAQSSLAGPCTQEIDQVQKQVDARIDAVAGAGRVGAESNTARLHREPTPASIAAAEQKLGEGKSEEAALAALGSARQADQAGDKAGCDAALAVVKKALTR